MKTTCTILLSGLLLCGCSQKQSGPAIDLLQSGKDIPCPGGTVLRIAKRVGTSLEGVTFVAKLPNGQTQTIRADTATLSPAPNATNGNSVIITLHSATSQVGSESTPIGEFPVHFSK